MNQLLRPLAAERRVLHRQKKERGVLVERGNRQLRQVAAATPTPVAMKLVAAELKRDLIPGQLRQRRALPVERQLDHSVVNEEERTKPLPHRRNQNNNNKRPESLSHIDTL